VKKAFPLRGSLGLEVLDLEHFALPTGSCTVLRGRSGSGKTTLLNLVAGITAPTAGTVHVADTDVFALSEARRDRFRAENIGYVFQMLSGKQDEKSTSIRMRDRRGGPCCRHVPAQSHRGPQGFHMMAGARR